LFHWAAAYSTYNARGPGDPGLRRDEVLATSVSTLLNRYNKQAAPKSPGFTESAAQMTLTEILSYRQQ
jgi:hypothetical protein